MVTTISTPLLKLNQVTTRPELYESLWVLVRRLMTANELRPHELMQRFAVEHGQDTEQPRFPHVYERLDLRALAPYLGLTPMSVKCTLPMRFEFARPMRPLGPLKYCPTCAEVGYHSVLHEVQWLDRCPIHEEYLLAHCDQCGRRLSHTTSKRLGQTPLTFPCGHAWTRADISHPPDIASQTIKPVAAWVRRLHAVNTGERWYAVALGRGHALTADDEDFRELLDLFAAIGDFPTALRDSLRLPRYAATRPVCSAFADLRTDWFDSALQRAGRYACILDRTDYDVSYMGDHRSEAVVSFRRLGKDAFLRAIRLSVEYLDLRTRRIAVRRTNRRITELLAHAFLAKHLLANTVNGADPYDTGAYLRMAMRMTGQPLGLLRETGSGVRFYWTPLAADYRRFLDVLERDDWVRRCRRKKCDSIAECHRE